MDSDNEVVNLFRKECEEHLRVLVEGLSLLREYPIDSSAFEAPLRAAHSLKGAARMMGLVKVGAIAHRLEDEISTAKRGECRLSHEAIDRLFSVVAVIQSLIHRWISENDPVHPSVDPASGMTPGSDSMREAPSTENGDHDTTPFPTVTVAANQWEAMLLRVGEVAVVQDTLDRLSGLLRHIGEQCSEGFKEFHSLRLALDQLDIPPGSDSTADLLRCLTDAQERIMATNRLVNEAKMTVFFQNTRLEKTGDDLDDRLWRSGRQPLSTVFSLFPRMVREVARQQGKSVRFRTHGGHIRADRRILEVIKAPIMHMLRNAVDHGIETPAARIAAGKSPIAVLYLRGRISPEGMVIEVEDDGRGIDVESVRSVALRKGIISEEQADRLSMEQIRDLIFRPGLTTSDSVTELSGRGIGLDVVRANVERLRGTIQVNTHPGQGSLFRIEIARHSSPGHGAGSDKRNAGDSRTLSECQDIPDVEFDCPCGEKNEPNGDGCIDPIRRVAIDRGIRHVSSRNHDTRSIGKRPKVLTEKAVFHGIGEQKMDQKGKESNTALPGVTSVNNPALLNGRSRGRGKPGQ